ncbi:succinyl-CoA synthetase, beta subunit [Rubidibacter lacunae KORDI 51-2]|uniref:Succinyl-CoA synthetase, beta subunit n=1 Tax=Rubidibacter lacunae KORDI 51-2 TaxID=582515 RepID=U5DFQ5_9CHRO|nr:ATP-grasp domain-containing protein [Rubidibacter lacunae]ERN40431.1 succinyl-CoA synthetase, beta subunit [Rubidibacter lacunae KORDI 51-2]
MDLLEYQAKELFRTVGIPILPSQRIDTTADLKRLQVPYPVVLKSQVRAGERGQVGGIRRVENTIDAIAAAQAIFNLPIRGERPRALLAEAHYNAARELFLSVVVDCRLQRPVLLGSACGGTDRDAIARTLQHLVVEGEFSPYHARQLALKMGLSGPHVHAVSTIVEKMYYLLASKDLDRVEIDPLAIGLDGEVMALDGKIHVNDSALGRHRDWLTDLDAPVAATASPSRLDWDRADGRVAIIGTSRGLVLAARDALSERGAVPSSGFLLAQDTAGVLLDDADAAGTIACQFDAALNEIAADEAIAVVLVVALGTAPALTRLAEQISVRSQPTTAATARGGEERVNRPTGAAWRLLRRETTTARPAAMPPPIVSCLLAAAPAAETTVPLPGARSLDAAVARATAHLNAGSSAAVRSPNGSES